MCTLTFAIEGMTISKDTRRNLDRIGSGQSNQQVVNELRVKYEKSDYILKVWCLHHGNLWNDIKNEKIK